MRRIALLALFSSLIGCEDRSYREIGAEISVLSKRTDQLVAPATTRLVARGRAALPQLEIALHTASVRGKLNLLAALDGIGEPESLAIVRHFAVYDASAEVRGACEGIVARWKTPEAQAAARWIAEMRTRGEGPIVVGESEKPAQR